VQRELTKVEVERLFIGAMDGALEANEAQAFEELLSSDGDLKARFERYQLTIKALKTLPREKAPPVLASMILRRTRRRRSTLRSLAEHEALHRFPVEVIIPLLLAAVVALFLVVAAR
jgi:anti-sigma-K factor RskA